jgi:hypothetical protein
MWFLLLVSTALAELPPGFEPLGEEGGCSFSRSVPEADGFPVLRAECRWPRVSAEALEAVLGDWAGHQDIWSTVASSRVVEQRGADSLVLHVHQAPAMVDRQILLRMWVEDLPEGRAFRWTRASPQPQPREGRVCVTTDDGSYLVRADREGSHLVATVHYDPGGRIPASLVRWFQVLGLPGMLEELREAALPSD